MWPTALSPWWLTEASGFLRPRRSLASTLLFRGNSRLPKTLIRSNRDSLPVSRSQKTQKLENFVLLPRITPEQWFTSLLNLCLWTAGIPLLSAVFLASGSRDTDESLSRMPTVWWYSRSRSSLRTISDTRKRFLFYALQSKRFATLLRHSALSDELKAEEVSSIIVKP